MMTMVRLRSPRAGQAGQGLLLALILLAIGALVTVPALTLTSTALRNSPIITQRAKDFYAADAAQEYTMWKLLWDSPPLTSNFTAEGQSVNFTVDICGSPVSVSVVMHAIASFRGVTLIGNTPIQPTITVSPSLVSPPATTTFTYKIKLEQISNNASQGLDAVYMILPSGFVIGDYVAGSSELSVDGGTWESISDPLKENGQTWPTSGPNFGGRVRLRWPNPLTYGQDNFASPMRDFAGGQTKEISFRMSANLPKNSNGDYYYFSWAVLKPWNTLSGASGVVTIRDGTTSQPKFEGGLVSTNKTTNKPIIPPGQVTDVIYTISIKNEQGPNDSIITVTDYLPPGFVPPLGYLFFPLVEPLDLIPTSNTTTYGNVNGVNRYTANFSFSPAASINSGATRTLKFKASTSEYVSGSYYNEVNVVTNNGIPTIFRTPGVDVSQADFATGYSWNSAAVVVPAYDAQATSGNVTTNANIAITSSGAGFSSYQIK